METRPVSRPRIGSAYALVAAVWGIYLLLSLLAPASETTKRLGLSGSELNLLRLSIALPLLFVWLAATKGALHLKQYARLIRESPDGQALNHIATGVLLLVIYLIVLVAAGPIDNYFPSPRVRYWIDIARDHLDLLISLAAFVYTYLGSLRLIRMVDSYSADSRRMLYLLLPYSLFAAGFTWLFYDLKHDSGTVRALYSLPDPVVLGMVVVPYAIMWFLGLLTAANLHRYATRAKGLIYKQALEDLVKGLLMVIAFAIGLQLFYVISGQLRPGPLLVLVYGLLLWLSIGYMYVARGASRLAKIEVIQ